MKVFICNLFILFFLNFSLNAQSTNIISNTEYENIIFNIHTISNLIEVSDYEVFLKQNYGSPTNKRCSENPMTIYGCKISYNGFELVFDYEDILFWINITNGLHTLQIGTKQFKVGSSVFELKSLFPTSYENRYSIEDEEGKKNFIRVDVSFEHSERNILFQYNESTNVITHISINTGGEH